MNVYSHKVLDIIGTTVELENLENKLKKCIYMMFKTYKILVS